MNTLESLGFDAQRYQDLDEPLREDLGVGRVAEIDRGRHLLLTPSGPRWSTCAGKLRHDHPDPAAQPAVGDWVQFRADTQTVRVLPRHSVFARRAVGGRAEAQVIAANVDLVFVVTAVGADLSPRRLERYVALVRSGGAEPVIVLNKTDLPFDVMEVMRTIDEAAPGVPLAMVSGEGGDLGDLQSHLRPARTVALVGSSGVGKSTIVNALLGEARQSTRAVRASDGTGRHTTTRRELVILPSGALLIDTPGMREVGMTGLAGVGEELDASFSEVTELAAQCRFTDCRHEAEPGCAVRAALERGDLSEARWRSHEQLRKEAAYEARRADVHHAHNVKARWKSIHLGFRERKKLDPKFKGG